MDDVRSGTPQHAHALRNLPQVQRLLERPETASLLMRAPRQHVVAALRLALDAARKELLAGEATPDPATLVSQAAILLDAAQNRGLARVINATGIVLHTNLGRAPLARAAREAMIEASGYANLEFALESGERGARAPGVAALLCALTGAEAALAVNNCAAAMLLSLSGLAANGEVLVSRGELIEIGGGFRIPDVIQQGGARLVEVGTTNKTRLDDYAAAITPLTRAILKVHHSNFRIVGFTAEADLAALAVLAKERGLRLIHDLGGGALGDLRALARAHEPIVAESVAAGADIVAFSGDKLVGGPQAGLIVGREEAVACLRRHPLMRALRLDKVSLAALEATLHLHQDPERARRAIPTLRMLAQTEAELQTRAEKLAALIAPPAEAEIIGSAAQAGGGALPAIDLPSRALALIVPGHSAEALARRLRLDRPAIVGRIAGERLLLDLFTLEDDDFPAIAIAIKDAAA
ncbi:MAG TPA: L-seryl-tRNA(Sec) selenium transferase [Rhodoblastus sp.]|nr:L-seryl-tRNA(Sec) selenium transferase [Rhodoblastus sp.]